MLPDSIKTVLCASTWRRALVLLIMFVALYTIRWFRPHTLSSATENTIRFLLRNEYLNRVRAGRQGPPTEETMKADAQLEKDIRLERITAKGLIWADYARVEVSVAGAPPPGGRRVRYFRIGTFGHAENDYDGWHYYFALW